VSAVHVGDFPVGPGTTIELLDVDCDEPRQKIVAVRTRWDAHLVGRINQRELERNQEILGLKTISLGGRGDAADQGAMLRTNDPA